MKSPIAALALLGLLTSSSLAQTGTRGSQRDGVNSTSALEEVSQTENRTEQADSNSDPKVFPSASILPAPTPYDELKPPSVSLPDEPIEPYLLSKEHGPFMVLARTFRGPDSDKLALALVKELREKYQLPAYILRSKDWPGRSNIRGIPPTADPQVVQANVSIPEKYRTYDEAAVLVGNEKTLKGSELLLHKVKKIKPECLNEIPTLFKWREGLKHAIRTTNPYVPAQELYPRKPDKLIVQMNASDRSIAHCPGRYSLQIAEFSGRSTFNPNDERFQGTASLRKSPLATAAEDAERLADKLSKDPEFRRLGQPVYVYHDRTSSRVFVGSFQQEKDPAAVAVRDSLLKMAVSLMDRQTKGRNALDTMIVPAGMLTELAPIKANFE